MMNIKKLVTFSILILAILSVAVFAALPIDWIGIARMGGSIAPDGTVITAFIDGQEVARTTIGDPTLVCSIGDCSGYYLIHVPGNEGDAVTFKINGVGANEGPQSWIVPQSTRYYYLDLSLDTVIEVPEEEAVTGEAGGPGEEVAETTTTTLIMLPGETTTTTLEVPSGETVPTLPAGMPTGLAALTQTPIELVVVVIVVVIAASVFVARKRGYI